MKAQFKQPQFRKMKGFTMIELLISIGVILFLSGLIFVAYRTVNGNSNATATQQEVMQIVTGVHSVNPTPSYGAAGTDLGKLLIAADKAPSNMLSGAAGSQTLSDAWGGTVTVLAGAAYGGGAAGNNFVITVPLVPTDVCTTLLSNLSNTFESMGTDTTALVKDVATNVVPTSATIVAACAKNSNQLTFTAP